jgi:UDP-GlcNAc:undecaprenyl-phosphate GlcNAc-1-phosphate transferase
LPTPLHVALTPLAIAFATTFVLAPQVRKFAIQCRVADKPNGRKLHPHAIPHFGGVAIFGGFFLALLVALATHPGPELAGRVLALLPSLLILFGLGLVDDLRGLRAGVKLLYQILAAVCAVAMGAGFQVLLAADVWMYAWAALVAVVWYVGVCNSINLIDGLDGLAAGTATIASASFLVVAWRLGDAAATVICTGLAGALLAFLRFNFHPARIFMGDTGSMFVGLTLGALACLLAEHVGMWTALLGSATILGVPIMDTAAAIVRRLAAGRHIFEADGEHTHHRLMRIGLSHRGAVLALYALGVVFAILGCCVFAGIPQAFIAGAGLGVGAATALAWKVRRIPVQAASRPALHPAPNIPSRSRPVPEAVPQRVVHVAREHEEIPAARAHTRA